MTIKEYSIDEMTEDSNAIQYELEDEHGVRLVVYDKTCDNIRIHVDSDGRIAKDYVFIVRENLPQGTVKVRGVFDNSDAALEYITEQGENRNLFIEPVELDSRYEPE
jgi:hypothetical protein